MNVYDQWVESPWIGIGAGVVLLVLFMIISTAIAAVIVVAGLLLCSGLIVIVTAAVESVAPMWSRVTRSLFERFMLP